GLGLLLEPGEHGFGRRLAKHPHVRGERIAVVGDDSVRWQDRPGKRRGQREGGRGRPRDWPGRRLPGKALGVGTPLEPARADKPGLEAVGEGSTVVALAVDELALGGSLMDRAATIRARLLQAVAHGVWADGEAELGEPELGAADDEQGSWAEGGRGDRSSGRRERRRGRGGQQRHRGGGRLALLLLAPGGKERVGRRPAGQTDADGKQRQRCDEQQWGGSNPAPPRSSGRWLSALDQRRRGWTGQPGCRGQRLVRKLEQALPPVKRGEAGIQLPAAYPRPDVALVELGGLGQHPAALEDGRECRSGGDLLLRAAVAELGQVALGLGLIGRRHAAVRISRRRHLAPARRASVPQADYASG